MFSAKKRSFFFMRDNFYNNGFKNDGEAIKLIKYAKISQGASPLGPPPVICTPLSHHFVAGRKRK